MDKRTYFLLFSQVLTYKESWLYFVCKYVYILRRCGHILWLDYHDISTRIGWDFWSLVTTNQMLRQLPHISSNLSNDQWLAKVKSISTPFSKTSPFPVSSFGNQVSFAERCNCARTTWFVRPSSKWQIISYNHFSKLTKKAKGRSFCCSHQTQGESRWTAAEGGCWLTSSWLKKSLGQDSMFYVWNYLVKIYVTRF